MHSTYMVEENLITFYFYKVEKYNIYLYAHKILYLYENFQMAS